MSNKAYLLFDKGKIGSKHQCLGLAQVFGVEPVFIEVPQASLLWRIFALDNLFLIFSRLSFIRSCFGLQKIKLEREGIIMIASGRRAVFALGLLKRALKSRIIAIALQRPTLSIQNYDFVICPRHDGLVDGVYNCTTVITTIGSLHHVTQGLIDEAQYALEPRLASSTRPIWAVMMGGLVFRRGIRKYLPFAQKAAGITDFQKLADKLQELAPGSLHFIPSRRTPSAVMRALEQARDKGQSTLWDPDAYNPYPGILGAADVIFVTGDSVNMLAEACSTGKPVYILRVGDYPKKFQAFHRALVEGGYARYWQGSVEEFMPKRLLDTKHVLGILYRIMTISR